MSVFANSAPFAELEQNVSTKLLMDDDVYGLVSEQLTRDEVNVVNSNITVRPHYGTAALEELVGLGVDLASVVPASLQVEVSGELDDVPGVEEFSFAYGAFQYVHLGALKKDGSQLWVHDMVGRLHEINQEDGHFTVYGDGPCDTRRFRAFGAWQAAHNTLLRVSRVWPQVHVDPLLGVWTDRPAGTEDHMETHL